MHANLLRRRVSTQFDASKQSKHKISCQIQRNKMNQIKVEEECLKVIKVEFEEPVKIEPQDSGEDKDQTILKLQNDISALKEKHTRYVLQKEAELCQKNLEIQQLKDEMKEFRKLKPRPDLRTKINGLKNRRLKDYGRTFPF